MIFLIWLFPPLKKLLQGCFYCEQLWFKGCILLPKFIFMNNSVVTGGIKPKFEIQTMDTKANSSDALKYSMD